MQHRSVMLAQLEGNNRGGGSRAGGYRFEWRYEFVSYSLTEMRGWTQTAL